MGHEVQIAKSENKQTMSRDCWLILDGRTLDGSHILPSLTSVTMPQVRPLARIRQSVGVGVVPPRYVYLKTFEARRLIIGTSLEI